MLALTRTPSRRATALSRSVQAPVGGLNLRDAWDDMDEQDAVLLDNWFPGHGKCSVRAGYLSHATGVGAGAVETLAEYHHGTVRQLIAAGGDALYDASSAGAATELGDGFTSARWQHVQFNGYLWLCNGADTPQTWDGTTLAAFTGTGPVIANVSIVAAHKNRLYLATNNSSSFWYGAVNAVTSGAWTEFNLSRVSAMGGVLVAIGSWTVDGGDGGDDLLVFFMSSGEAIVYNGSDPGTAADWSLVGKFIVGAPLGPRCVMKVGPDLGVVTRIGVIPFSRALIDRGLQRTGSTISDKVDEGIASDAAAYGDNFGWQLILGPGGHRAYVNVPVIEGSLYRQYVLNIQTNAWCRYTGIPARCWGTYANDLYFGGGGGVVFKAETGFSDDGAAISADGRQAFTHLKRPGIRKRVTGVRPVMASEGTLESALHVDVDFGERITAYQASSFVGTGSEWDVATWDVAEWAQEHVIVASWRSVSAAGRLVSTRLRTRTDEQRVDWYATEYIFEPAGPL